VLTEEAARLESAAVHNAKPARERNNILDNEMSNWMLSSIQRHQIQKTAAGTALLTGAGLSQYPKINPSPLISEFNDSVKYQSSSPSRMMPFDQFHTMFRQYSQQRLNPTSPKTTTEKLSKSRASRRRSMSSGEMNPALMAAASAVNAAMAAAVTHPQPTTVTEPINAVKLLADFDPHFSSYMKVVNNHQLDTLSPMKAKTLKLNSKISSKSQRIRKSIPLGRDAVQLVDSRGMPSKESSKGFNNVFVERDEEEGQGQGQGEEQSPMEATGEASGDVRTKVSVSIVEGDLMSRLAHKAYRATFSDPLDDGPAAIRGTLSMGDLSLSTARMMPISGNMESPLGGAYIRSPSIRPNRQRRPGSETRKSTSPSGTTNEAGRLSAKSGILIDDEEYEIPEVDRKLGVQDKLIAAWDALQVSAVQRFAFMRKYSTVDYSTEMTKAVDMWSEVAVFAVTVYEAHKLLNKIKEGRVVIPLSQLSVLKAIRKKMSPLLATPSDAFIPPALKLDPMMACTNPPPVIQTIPLSAAAVVRVEELITELFIRIGSPHPLTRVYVLDSLEKAIELVTAICTEGIALLKTSLKSSQDELNDLIPFGAKGCKEWATSVMSNLSGLPVSTNRRSMVPM